VLLPVGELTSQFTRLSRQKPAKSSEIQLLSQKSSEKVEFLTQPPTRLGGLIS